MESVKAICTPCSAVDASLHMPTEAHPAEDQSAGEEGGNKAVRATMSSSARKEIPGSGTKSWAAAPALGTVLASGSNKTDEMSEGEDFPLGLTDMPPVLWMETGPHSTWP